MSKEMKIIMENFRRSVLNEQAVQTVGELKKILTLHRQQALGKGAAKIAGGAIVDSVVDEITGKVPGLQAAFNLFAGLKNTRELLKKLYSAEDDFKTNTGLDKLNVNDDVSKIVDDPIEDAFLKVLIKSLETMDDNDPIPDVNEKLQDFIKLKFNQHSVED